MKVPCKNIPTYDANTKTWSKTSFKTQKEFVEFLLQHCFKEPGEYGFDKSTFGWNEAAKEFAKNKQYTEYAETTPEYIDFWDSEKLKSRLGVLWKHDSKTWYLTRDYYFLLNYCPITNKEIGNEESFMSVRDVQYHMMIYEKIAELFHKHSVILKKRQMAFSYCHTAKCLNFLWFENKKTIKIFASDEAYLNAVNGCWKMIDTYKNHLNKNTDWKRVFVPGEYPELKQVEKIQDNRTKEWTTVGNESTLNAKSLAKDVVKSVGGAGFYYWHEEGGVAPKADEALMYIDPALEVTSTERSGSFCIGGSVGDLDQCKPLEEFMKNPEIWNFYPTTSKWIDTPGIEKVAGLFIPTQYGMKEAVDEFGNTLVEKALEILDKQEIEWKKLPSDKYAIKKSQNPRTMKEAFAWRKHSEFNIAAIERQQERIKLLDKEDLWEVKPIKCLLYRDSTDGKIKRQLTNLPPEIEYPVNKDWPDKRGVVVILEEPEKNAPFYTYFAGVDPVEVGNTTTSNSVFSISIWKRPVEEEYIDEDGNKQIRIRGDNKVAYWRGRFDSTEKTNEHASLLVQMYKAYTLVERNKPNFINFFERKLLTHLLAKEREIEMFKEYTYGRDNSQYGFYKGSNGKAAEVFKEFKKLFKEYMEAEYEVVHEKKETPEGELKIQKVFKGIDRQYDYWFLEELKLYNDDNIENFDRVISDFAGYYIMKLYAIKNGVHRIKVSNSSVVKKQTNKYIFDFINNKKKTKKSFDFTKY